MLAIPGLVVGRELSRGGFKRHRVYTVVVSQGAPSWTQPHSTIAVKFFEHETMLCPAFLDFEREAEALKSIHHEHVVSALHTLINDRWSAIFMPLVSGVPLSSIQVLRCADVDVIVSQVLEGLHAVHLAGFAHRDISVHNVLYDADRGRATLLDLDYCCKIVDASSTGVSTDCPHSEYRAPAAYRGTVLARDIWSLGILVAKVLELVEAQEDPSFHEEGCWWQQWSGNAQHELQVHSAEGRVNRERNAAARALAATGHVAWYARLLQRLLYLYPSQRVLPALRSQIDVLIPG
jgi:serine/threonine protein kinase